MGNLDTVRAHNKTLVNTHPLVAVFIGGTSGIGEYSARALATAHGKDGKGLRLYIVGRNEAKGKAIIADLVKVCPVGEYRFVRAEDLTLLRDVDHVCEEIVRLEEEEASKTGGKARIDYLVMSQGFMVFDRQETKEGIDKMMSLLYYSRMRCIMKLLPLLLESPLPAHVVSVFGPQRDDRIFPEDLSLRDPKHYGFMNMGSHVSYMTTFFFERLAAQHPEQLSLIHYFPSLVITDAFADKTLPWWFKVAWRCVGPFARPFTVPQFESGERVLFLTSPRFPARPASLKGEDGGLKKRKAGDLEVAVSSDGIVGGGAYRANYDGETIPVKKIYAKLREDDMSKKSWDHTMKAFEEIEAGRVFTG